MREWMEKEGKVRDERGRRAQMEVEEINKQLKVIRRNAEKVEDEEKRRKYESFEERRPVQPVAGLMLRKNKKVKKVDKRFESEARGSLGGGDSAF